MLPTADLCDAHADVSVLEPGLRSYGGRRRFCGPVLTVRAFEDNSRVKQALSEDGAGRVLVIDGGESTRCALLGGNLAALAVRQGWAGVVVVGAVRDAVELAAKDVGLLALATCPRRSLKRDEGQIGPPVTVLGATIATGDHLYADEDGVVVSARALE